MKKILFTLTLIFACCATTMAQQAKIAFFSYNEVLTSLPAYSEAQSQLDALRKQYAEELKAAESEFNEKYELFLDQAMSLAQPIREKRQADLEALLERNAQFKQESARLVAQAEKEAMAPIKAKISAAIKALGAAERYIVILNTDSEACPYIDPTFSEDVTARLIKKIEN